MRQFLHFSRIARDCKINAREGVKMRHFRAKSQHLDTLVPPFSAFGPFSRFSLSLPLLSVVVHWEEGEGKSEVEQQERLRDFAADGIS